MARKRVSGFVYLALVSMGATGIAAADDKPEPAVKVIELAFDDSSNARAEGRLVGPATHEYTFNARKGQKVELAVSSELSPWIGIDLVAPVFAPTVKDAPAVYTNFIDGTTSWEGVVPGTGTYTVRLVLLRSEAKAVGRVDYELDVKLK